MRLAEREVLRPADCAQHVSDYFSGKAGSGMGYFFSKLFFSPQLGHFCGLHLASFSNPHLLHLKSATTFPPNSAKSPSHFTC
jgi:hypothetical protein